MLEGGNTMNLFKISYNWYEGEYEDTLLGKDVTREQFEKDLLEAKLFAISLKGIHIDIFADSRTPWEGNGYSVECLPEYYGQIVWFLINKKDYIECSINENITYDVDDWADDILIYKSTKEINRTDLL
jgi:hypothetical protein